jgi:hypothetical protein
MNLEEFNFSDLTHPELAELKAKIEVRLEEMRVAGVAALRERLIEDAAALGVTIDEVVVPTKGKRGRPRKPRNSDADGEVVL